MTNHVRNIIKMNKSTDEILEKYKKDFKGSIDFEKIIPLDGKSTIDVWGVKWNAFGEDFFDLAQREDIDCFMFLTPWSDVQEIVLELSRQNKGIKFEYFYEGEFSEFIGHKTYIDGQEIKSYTPLQKTDSFRRIQNRMMDIVLF